MGSSEMSFSILVDEIVRILLGRWQGRLSGVCERCTRHADIAQLFIALAWWENSSVTGER